MGVAVSVKRALCADVSGEAHEALGATASRIDRWLLVEYRGLWDRDVLGGSLLSEPLKEHLRDQLGQLGHARLLFVKRPERRSQARRMLYVGSSRPGEESLYALEFERHEDLLEYDFAGALLGGETPGVPVEHPIFIVCTHGKRDRCCAKYGRPLYDALKKKIDPAWVWQSTHVGGDRFAANVVVLPEGLYFGRVDDEDIDPLLDEYFDGRIHLDRYRGRSTYTFPVQAAEQAVREAEGLTEIDAIALEKVERRGDGWRVTLRVGGKLRRADVESVLAEEPVYLTCGSVTPQRPRHYLARLL
jgi:hypothetical protein